MVDWKKLVAQLYKYSKVYVAGGLAFTVAAVAVVPATVSLIPMDAYAVEEAGAEGFESTGETGDSSEGGESSSDTEEEPVVESEPDVSSAQSGDSIDEPKIAEDPASERVENESEDASEKKNSVSGDAAQTEVASKDGTNASVSTSSENVLSNQNEQNESGEYEPASGYSVSGGSGYWKKFSAEELQPEEALQHLKTSVEEDYFSSYEEDGRQWAAYWILLTEEDRGVGIHSGRSMKAADLMGLYVMATVYDRLSHSEVVSSTDDYIEGPLSQRSYPDILWTIQGGSVQALHAKEVAGAVSRDVKEGEEDKKDSVELDQETYDLIYKMVAESDEEAADEILTNVLGNGNLVKGIAAVNEFLRANNFTGTTMGRPMGEAQEGRENYTTAFDCARFMRAIYEGKLVSENASEQMLDILKKQQNKQLIPAGVQGFNARSAVTANKASEMVEETGEVVANDCAIVCADKNDYVMVVLSCAEEESEEEGLEEQIAGLIGEVSQETYSTIGTANLYLPVNDKSHWDAGTDIDLPYDVSTKRDENFVRAMLEYACYWDGCIPYASSQNKTDPDNMRSKRLRKGGRTDCSWFVYHVLHKFGLLNGFTHSYEWGNDPGTYPGGHNIGSDVSKASPGDILCMGAGEKPQNSHVAIYIGNGMQVECGSEDGVKVHAAPDSVRAIIHFDCLPK